MRANRIGPILSYDLRFPDEAQSDALRLLDASRAVVNATLTQLWPSLDAFAAERTGQAWKQIGEQMGSPDPHGDRQWRRESETAGRILRAQATRQRASTLIQPILTDGFIWPKTERRPAGKNRHAIKEALNALKQVQTEAASGQEDGETTFVALQNVVEQACNFYLANDRFPDSYAELQPIPVLDVGLLTDAGDDGPDKGQAYRLPVDTDAGVAYFRCRCPDAQGKWGWRADEVCLVLPQRLRDRLRAGEWQAPTLREERNAVGARYAVLDISVAVEPAELPVWEHVERVMGAD
jgi:putative transposase